MKFIPNIITCLRILASLLILFVPNKWFFPLYFFAGLTDMLSPQNELDKPLWYVFRQFGRSTFLSRRHRKGCTDNHASSFSSLGRVNSSAHSLYFLCDRLFSFSSVHKSAYLLK